MKANPIHARPVYTRLAAALCFAAAAFAAWHSVRLAWADKLYEENTLSSLQRAVALESGNAAYHELLGEHLESLGSDPTPEFVSAAQLSPRDAHYWIRLSFFHEVQGRYQEAEKELLEADKVNRKFDPPWALMNFYFRRNSSADFWRWARRSFAIGYDDMNAVFRLCWEVSPDWRATAAVLPPSHDMRLKYLSFLLSEGHAARTGELAQQAARNALPADVPLLLTWADRALADEMPAAVAVWNILCERGLIHQKPLSGVAGQLIATGDFSVAPTEGAFGWRVGTLDGIVTQFPDDGDGVEFEFSGSQPENCELLWLPIPTSPGAQYALDYQYKVSGSDRTQAVGVHWELAPLAGGAALARSDDFTVASEWAAREFQFTAGDNGSARLVLRYTRPPGAIRWKGGIRLRKVVSRLSR